MGDEVREGRPPITPEQKTEMLQKLEPYLKSGLSTRKALIEAGIPNSTFYHLMDSDDEFREQINRFRQFISVLLNNAVIRQLQAIIQKQNDKVALTKDEVSFMQWFAINSNHTKDEFGERKEIGIYDPEVEIQRLASTIDEKTKGGQNGNAE